MEETPYALIGADAPVRARHLPFTIGMAERDAWMACMKQAMQSVIEDEGLRAWLPEQLYKTANRMRNREG